MLCSVRSTRTSKSIEMINFYDEEYEFLNIRWWWITFSFLIDNEYFSIFNLNKFVNVLSFIFLDMFFFWLDIILDISNLLSILNLIFYFLNCAIYHIWFESRLKSVIFFFVLKESRFCVIRSKQLSFLTILFWLQFRVIHIKEEKYW